MKQQLQDNFTATMSAEKYKELYAAWERDKVTPDLLEALKRVCAYTRHDSTEHKIAQAAIDKAEGRS